jgi:Mce-associated membrane protein
VALAAVLALLAVLVASLVVLVLRASAHAARDDARDAAVASARQEAVNLTTISYTTAARDLDRILAGATGPLRAKFESERTQFPTVLAREKSESRGTVLSAALVRVSVANRTAQVVVAADATVTTGAGGSPQSAVKHFRMVMQLLRVNDRWLVSDVAFAGAPQ